jgi:hypothetical protein
LVLLSWTEVQAEVLAEVRAEVRAEARAEARAEVRARARGLALLSWGAVRALAQALFLVQRVLVQAPGLAGAVVLVLGLALVLTLVLALLSDNDVN